MRLNYDKMQHVEHIPKMGRGWPRTEEIACRLQKVLVRLTSGEIISLLTKQSLSYKNDSVRSCPFLKIDIHNEKLSKFCRRHHIRKLSFFGSVVRDDFGPASDVDVLVEFEPGARVGLITLAGMEIELGRLLGRRVEMHTPKGLNPHFRSEVLDVAEVHYEQA